MTELLSAAAGLLAGAVIGGVLMRRRTRRIVRRFEEAVTGRDLPASLDEPFARIAATVARQREAAAHQLADREADQETLRRVLLGFPDPVLLVGRGGEIRFANQAARALVGSSIDDAGHLLHHRLLELIRTGRSEPQVTTLERLEEQRTYAATTQRQDDGEVLVVLRDITHERRVSEIRRDFVADASHELKTPVATIQAASDTVLTALADGDLDSARTFAQRVAESSLRLSRIVADLLDLSRLEAQVSQQGEVDLAALMAELVGQFHGAPQPMLVAPAEPVVVVGSAADLRLAVSNLVGNAVRHTPATGSVGVRLFPADSHVEIRVSDTGEGIPSKHLPRIFERFYRVDPARSRDTGGTGLGLSIVRHVIAQHGGSIHVESVLGEGTTFTIRLPWPAESPTSTPRSGHSQEHPAGPA